MTPVLTIRSFSTDQYVLDKIFYSNYYGIKNVKGTVVDIGAHCGYFSFCAMALGAEKIFCFEPFFENYKILLDNLFFNNNINSVTPNQLGVYAQNGIFDFDNPPLLQEKYFDYSNFQISEKKDNVAQVQCITLNQVLAEIVKVEVDLLKINLGYAETDILLSSNLASVKNICGEGELDENSSKMFKAKMFQLGFVFGNVKQNKDMESRYLFQFSREESNFKEMFI